MAAPVQPAGSAGHALEQVLDGHGAAPGPRAGDHDADQLAAPGRCLHDGREPGHHPPVYPRGERAGALLRRVLPPVRHRERGPDTDQLRWRRLHDGEPEPPRPGDHARGPAGGPAAPRPSPRRGARPHALAAAHGRRGGRHPGQLRRSCRSGSAPGGSSAWRSPRAAWNESGPPGGGPVQRHGHPPHRRDASLHVRRRGGRRAAAGRPHRQSASGDRRRAAGQGGRALPPVRDDVQPGRVLGPLPGGRRDHPPRDRPPPALRGGRGRGPDRSGVPPAPGRARTVHGHAGARGGASRGALHAAEPGGLDRADGQHRGRRVLAPRGGGGGRPARHGKPAWRCTSTAPG